MAFGGNLARFRKEKGLTQEDLVRKSGVAISQIRRYEADKSSPTLDVVTKLAKALGVSLDELVFDKATGVAGLRILDRRLLEQFEMLSTLNAHDKDAVQTVIDSVIIKNRLEDVLPAKSDATWTKEMRHVVAELRKGAAKYSDDEVDRLVNDAVTAVRGERVHQRVKVGA
jgi:transcriptional regulator with XRE-family HTH domain